MLKLLFWVCVWILKIVVTKENWSKHKLVIFFQVFTWFYIELIELMIMKLKEVFLDIFVQFGAEKFVYD